jgi:hypothetical protein
MESDIYIKLFIRLFFPKIALNKLIYLPFLLEELTIE